MALLPPSFNKSGDEASAKKDENRPFSLFKNADKSEDETKQQQGNALNPVSKGLDTLSSSVGNDAAQSSRQAQPTASGLADQTGRGLGADTLSARPMTNSFEATRARINELSTDKTPPSVTLGRMRNEELAARAGKPLTSMTPAERGSALSASGLRTGGLEPTATRQGSGLAGLSGGTRPTPPVGRSDRRSFSGLGATTNLKNSEAADSSAQGGRFGMSANPVPSSTGGSSQTLTTGLNHREGVSASRYGRTTDSAFSSFSNSTRSSGSILSNARNTTGAGATQAAGGITSSGGVSSTSTLGSVGAKGRSSLAGSRAQIITDEEFLQLQDFIYVQSGIYIAETRKYLVENRLSNRLRELNLKSFNEYYYYLRFDKNKVNELQQLFNVITTNETSFYRNPPQLKVFQDVVVPQELAKIQARGQRKLRIWSAGCSTGEEPYTLAIILKEVLQGQIGQWDIKITANDLSENVLRAAQRGIYNEYALRTTPPEIVDKYFKKDGITYHIEPSLKRMVSFGSINLSNRAMLKRVERSDIIFCRNVIIYFDEEMKRQVIESFYDNLLPGGSMLIGHSESLHNLSRAFTPEHHPGTIVYRKQE